MSRKEQLTVQSSQCAPRGAALHSEEVTQAELQPAKHCE